MVEGNEKHTNDSDSRGNAPKRRGGLFGSRRGRGRSAETPPVEPGSQPVTETDVPTRDTAANEPAAAAPGVSAEQPARADEPETQRTADREIVGHRTAQAAHCAPAGHGRATVPNAT